jgi:hypothetical protein
MQAPHEAELTKHVKFMRTYLQTVIDDRRDEIDGVPKSRSSPRMSTKRESSKRQSGKRQSTRRESTKRESTKRESTKRESTKRESTKRQSSKRESTSNRESTSSKRHSSKRSSKRVSGSVESSSAAAAAAATTSRGDLLSMYIEYAKATNNPDLASDEGLQDMIINMLVAGRDTTSCLLTHCFNALDKHPYIQDKLVEEFSQVFTSSADVTLDAMKGCGYADAVFNETLRTTPPVCMIMFSDFHAVLLWNCLLLFSLLTCAS